MGKQVRPKEDSNKVFLLGDCAVSSNEDLKNAITINGCPPPILNAATTIVLKSLSKQKAAKILMLRTMKNMGMKLGLYHEAFPVFGVYESPVFDEKHF